ncbi:tRNA (N6-isopentenyl adenosine(37)-C2)-methylthiotransferase MiaB [Fundidesulfovibrio soli]|uniref:tRNA (N6-isopentenyl adenosine(37)-C2)-methylthiotransferase MiaB n=1 Tax=Fundidesulfovibrio soli TaxID=2922716 RepID=UPI001FAECC6F|nr:tRNA (N6-isopentenyl adenosine(37)-C2)-methylthiotransferase MiaB [Fundidesulfovibrio soli]
MKFHVFTFGCQMNAADSGWLTRSLENMGWEKAPADQAKAFIVNTCSVREKPEQKLYSELGRIAEHLEREPGLFCAVGGCVAQQVGAKLWNRFPFVRLVFGTDGVAQAPQALARIAREPRLRVSLLDFSDSYIERDAALPGPLESPRAFVNIMQGCDNFCTYCIVPYVRGRQKSRTSEAVLAECRSLAERGVKDVTLLGQNVNSYGRDKGGDGTSFPQLLRAVAAVDGIERVRFTTSHPKDIAPEVVAAFGELENICPTLHLPVQSGSDDVLRRMGRSYTVEKYLGIVDALRRARPDISLTTDFIVGFPGETEEDFKATLELIPRAGFEGSFSFIYSDRPGVAAAKMEPKIPAEIKSWRLDELQALQNARQQSILQGLVSSVAPVLVEGPGKRRDSDAPAWRGRDAHGRTVNFLAPASPDLFGRIVNVRVTEAKKHSLWGEILP